MALTSTDYLAILQNREPRRKDVAPVQNAYITDDPEPRPQPTRTSNASGQGKSDSGGGLGGLFKKGLSLLNNIDRPRGFTTGLLSGGLDDAIEGFKDPSSASGRDIFGISKLNDTDFIGSLSLRDIAGGVAEIATDPLTFAIPFGGGALSGAFKKAGVRGVGAFVEPITGGSRLRNVGAEISTGLAARGGGELAQELAPEKFKPYAALAGGLLGGVGGANLAGARRNPFKPRNLDNNSLGISPFEDVININIGDEIIQEEGQLIRRSSIGPRFLDKADFEETKDLLKSDINDMEIKLKEFPQNEITSSTFDRLDELKEELHSLETEGFSASDVVRADITVNRINAILSDDEGVLSPLAINYKRKWAITPDDSSIRKSLTDLSNGISISDDEFNVLTELYQNGEGVRKSIRTSDPLYNKLNDTTTFYRGENNYNLETKKLGVPQRHPQIVQGYTVDHTIAAGFAPKVGPDSLDNFIQAKATPVDDVFITVGSSFGEAEVLVIDTRKLNDADYLRLTGKVKSGSQKIIAREKAFLPNENDTSARLGFAEEAPGPGNLEVEYIPSAEAIEAKSFAKRRHISVRGEKGRLLATQMVDEAALDNPDKALVRSDAPLTTPTDAQRIETVGQVTKEGSEAGANARTARQVGREIQETAAIKEAKERFGVARNNNIVARERRNLTSNQGVREGQAPSRVLIPERTTGTELPVVTQPRAYSSDGTAVDSTGARVKIPRTFDPERVRNAPELIADSIASRNIILSTLRKAVLKDIAESYDIPTKGLTRADLIALISDKEHAGRFQPLYAGVQEMTNTARSGKSIISTDQLRLPQETLTGSTYYNHVNDGTLPAGLQEIANELAKSQKDLPTGMLEKITQNLKMMWASADGSFVGIQGLLTGAQWALSPGGWANIGKFMGITLGSLFAPTTAQGARHSANMLNNLNRNAVGMGAPTLEQISGEAGKAKYGDGLYLSTVEGMIDIGAKSSGVPVIGKMLDYFNRLWSNQGDFMRAQNFYDTWARYGGPKLTDEQVGHILTATNRMTGISSKNRLGSQASMVLFAPRFLQSQLETVAKQFEFGTIEGNMARRSMASLIGTGVMITVAANEMNAMRRDGEDYEPFTNTDFNPIGENGRPNSNFMRITNAFGTDVSVFGPWDTLLRTAIAIKHNPREGTRDAFRSKSAPLVSLGWNLFSGKTFFGEDFDVTDPDQMMREIFTPFAWRDIGNEPWSGIAFGALGVKASPLTANEQLEIKMRNAGRDAGDPLDRRQWLVEHPEDRPKSSSADQASADLVRGDIEQRHQLNEIRTMQPGPDQQTLVQYTDNRRILQREIRNRLSTIFGDDFGDRKPANERERWIQEYFNLFDAVKNDITHDVNGQGFDQVLAAWTKENGPEALAYVNEFNLIGNLALETQYLDSINQLDKLGYFDMPRYQHLNGKPANVDTRVYEQELENLRGHVSSLRLSNPRLQQVDYATAVWQVLMEEGVSRKIVADVVNIGKESFESREYAQLKQARPDLTVWFNPVATYQNLQQLQGQGNNSGGRNQAAIDAFLSR